MSGVIFKYRRREWTFVHLRFFIPKIPNTKEK